MVMLVLKEGPGGNAWKQAINTIDVLLWSVQPHEEGGDRDRLATVNPRLLNNLRKAFRIASIGKPEIDELIEQLQQVQNETFHALEEDSADEEASASDTDAENQVTESIVDEAAETATDEEDAPEESEEPAVRFLKAGEDEGESDSEAAASETEDHDTGSSDEQQIETPEDPGVPISIPAPEASEPAAGQEEAEEATHAQDDEMAEDDPYMKQVDTLSVGVWVEFAGEDDNNTRCKLAAKINAIDKFIFVNRQGVKVVEKTRLGLARELRDGTVNIISDGLLFSRALESVIGNLRESQHEQHTGSAYQPTESASEE
jgi:hypothetical protein